MRAEPEEIETAASGSRSAVSQIRERVRRWSPELSPDSATAEAATLLLASRVFSQNVDRLSLVTGIRREFVARCARRLVDNGVWASGRLVCAWAEEEGDSLAFWADVGVAEGKLCRRVTPEGRVEWAPAGHWRKSYDYVRRAEHAEGSICYHEVLQHASSETTVSVSGPGRPPQRPEAGRTPPRRAAGSTPSPHAADGPAKEPSQPRVRHLGSPDHFTNTVWLT